MSKVSIIVPFYNCPYINQALDSLVNQTYSNIEIIVVNDGSTQFSEKITPYLDKIKYIQKENGGTASALNTGIKHATGDYFCWLSSDDIYYLEKIEIQLTFMKKENSLFSYTNYYSINEKNEIITPTLGINPPNRLQLLKIMSRGNIINGCTVMINKNVFDHTGVFDETLPYTHDYDLWLRIIQKFNIHYLDQPLLLYRVHKQMGTKKHADIIKKEIKLVVNRHKALMRQLLLEQLRKQ
ncbi:glycosyltransferase family 2 protein [Priestia megaterium]|jgi:glycosyltransferase involved in cell wall biosynthesis|uniref:glycosyltransferase family 2 protein n=1 Tax=Priestia megaterium TaxID=1404 RepID=UPI0020795F7C|nr:glycosyltransferase [Priestia megaterium]USL27633.1 glycosyltransferase [Priestia megaterium]WDM31650.1 glycosyltransferase [Priestia megaterium]